MDPATTEIYTYFNTLSPHDALPASELSFDDILQHLAIERQIGNDLLEPAVLILQLAQPPHLRWQQPRVLLLPVEVGRLTDPRLAADLSDWRSFLTLLDDERLRSEEHTSELQSLMRISYAV